ncbi:hypothetical protein CDO44_18635 [Pigmentiphaga sp. NML080357]|uniref:hypothetical protein n=1 Tax=Pigmentiphaga sp. NML080357 TaxID=2008675 RepID=UPI000B40B6C7|nr:hypothetical protein [Pigmentiphaga sp. NML080357]OVZ57413.1 hypothetical protein CDO44_18635 [Pigmentiphaga sp. NML080357]
MVGQHDGARPERGRLFARGAVLAGLFLACRGALAVQPCAGVAANLTQAQKAEYATLVAHAVGGGVRPSQIVLARYMQSGAWSAVYASTPRTDPGVLFFEEIDGRKQFREAWGGWADRSEQAKLVDWARKLGAPESLARCFANVVTH